MRLIFRTFVSDPDQMARLVEHQVGEFIRHDEERDSELRTTFWAYQAANCNMNLTAKAIYAHRQTVSNRLARIEELTGLDPTSSGDRELLCLSLQAEYVVRNARPRPTWTT
jgi:DNA-binding PucR family transcriptional regulator